MNVPLPRSFYLQPTVEVARALLGKMVIRTVAGGRRLTGLIVETEAYLTGDPASHAYRGKTPRNAVMFGPAGHAYIYISYGVHSMLNVVTAGENMGEAVLIRAIEPIEGVETIRTNRGGIENVYRLTNGPGKLGQALALTVNGENGIDLTDPRSTLLVTDGQGDDHEIVTTTRIGLTVGVEAMWRFYLKGNRWVSRR